MSRISDNALQELRYSLQIDDLIRFHKYSYKYPGQTGGQYPVIISILHEMSNRKQNSSSFIRWYAVIINLIESFQQYLSETPILRINEAITQPEAPLYLEKLELLVTGICRLGIILSTGKKILPAYVEKKLRDTSSQIKQLSPEISADCQLHNPRMVFIWTFILSVQHLRHLSANRQGGTVADLEKYISNDRFYKKMIQMTLSKNPANRTDFYQIENFWNGFIP